LTHPTSDRDTPLREDDAHRSYYADLALILKVRWIGMFAAYLDESGQDDHGVFVVAGYLFEPKRADEFSHQWSKMLDFYDVPELHMKKLAHYKSAKPGKIYYGWNDDKRKYFLSDAIAIIHHHARAHIVVCMDVDALNSLLDADRAVLLDSTKYTIAASVFFGEVVRQIGKDDPIIFLYDEVQPNIGKERLDLEFRNQKAKGNIHRMSDLRWRNSVDFEGIQAADFLAYEFGREYATELKRANYPLRTSGLRLVTGMGARRRREARIERDELLDQIAALRAVGGLAPIVDGALVLDPTYSA
jgi:hypothetical protein